jgi:hypothetical protein
MLAGMNPDCPVLNPIAQMMTLFVPATIHPDHLRRPIKTVERIVRKHEM